MHRKKPGSTQTTKQRTEAVQKLEEIIHEIKSGMFTTQSSDQGLHSRPMMYQEFDSKTNKLWFFTGKSTGKVAELKKNPRVNVAFASPKTNSYVSMAGTASVIDDREKEKELWNPFLLAWFPKGLEDPDLCLICVKVQTAEYWENTSSSVVQVIGLAKAIITGKPYESDKSENQKVYLN